MSKKSDSHPTIPSILVVDDHADTREILQRNLEDHGYRVYTAPGVVPAIRLLQETSIDLVITDLKMPEISGIDLVRHVRENFRHMEVMMITGYASIKGAVEAIKYGAEEYLSKPFTDEELLEAVGRVLEKLERRKNQLAFPLSGTSAHGIIGQSEAMRRVFTFIHKAATTPATILITGESGTGKELVARAIHYNSNRANAPFVAVNCGGIPETLLESELFGYLKGSFTGANETRAGFFQTADGGTIFLDEISETSVSMQVKLLRVLQEKEVCMVGSRKPQKIDVRIIAATNKDLAALVKKETFREDLYYRLNVLTLSLPPLREREDDILLLINHFAAKFTQEMRLPPPHFSDQALQVLKSYSWPGNVRELENLVQRLVVMSESQTIDVRDLPEMMHFSAMRGSGLNRTLAEVEAEYIRNVVNNVGGNKTQAAAVLGIDRKTLRLKLKEAGIEE